MKYEVINSLKIEKVVYNGYGLGFYDNNPVFVSYALPGQIVNVRVLYTKKSSIFASITKIIKQSADFVAAECTVFKQCGGCQWLNMKYQTQLEAKTSIIKEIYRHKFESLIENTIPSTREYNYRNKVFFPVSEIKNELAIGMYQVRTHHVIQHDLCSLIPKEFDLLLKQIQSYLVTAKETIYKEKKHSGNIRHIGFRISEKTGEILVIIVTKTSKLAFSKILVKSLIDSNHNISGIIQNINRKKGNTILGNEQKILFGKAHLVEQISNIKYRTPYNSFFQTNPYITGILFDFIKQYVDSNDTVLDAYCGIGAIALYLADKVKSVTGIEINKNSIEYAIKNSQINKITNSRFVLGKVEEKIYDLINNKFTTIILDPPRKGLDDQLFPVFEQISPSKIIYVSCHPYTQKRDIDKLLKLNYKIVKIQPFDMFPQTFHIENVIILQKNS